MVGFQKPKELGAIKHALEEQGHYYPVTTLSRIMFAPSASTCAASRKGQETLAYVG